MPKPLAIRARNAARHMPVAAACLLVALAPSTTGHAEQDAYGSRGTQRHTTETCRGVPATHVDEDGTGGDDVIVVTAPITISGWSGNDLICVKVPFLGQGADIDGGEGNDTIITLAGDNYISGGPGDDSILSNSTDHILDGDDGDDTIYMGRQPDLYAYGGDGNDVIFGTPYADDVHAGSGDDLVIGFAGNDRLRGGDGNDRLEGRGGSDTLDGQAGNDSCSDAAAPATTFVSCETIIGFGVIQGPGGLQLG